MIALQLSDDNLSKQHRRREIIDGLSQLSNNIKKVLQLNDHIKSIATDMKSIQSLILLGRGFQGATCLEGALKIKEVAYIHAEGILAGELKHGPLALVEPALPLLMIMNKDRHYVVSF